MNALNSARSSAPRWRLLARGAWLIAAVCALLLVASLAMQEVQRAIRAELSEALGPHAHWRALHVGLSEVVLDALSVDAAPGWPVPFELTAERVRIVLQLSSLWQRRPLVITLVQVEGGSAALLRDAQGLQIFPMLLRADRPRRATADTTARLWIQNIHVAGLVVDFYDRTVTPANYRVRLSPTEGTLADVRVPLTGKPLELSFAAPVVTPEGQAQGSWSIAGAITPHIGSDLDLQMHAVDVASLGPYLAKAGDTGVSGGTVSMAARSQVTQGELKASGVLTLHDLRLASTPGLKETVLGLPRRAVIDSLTNRQGDIVLHFSLAGKEDDPHFSLNEAASTRLTAALAESLGLPLDTLAKGVGSLSERGMDVAGKAASDVTDAVKGLLQQKPKTARQSR